MCRLHAALMRSAGRTVRSALPLPPRRAETAAMNDEAAEPGAVIRVLVAEDTRILRETLVTLFSLEDGIEVVAQVAAGTGIVPASRCWTSACPARTAFPPRRSCPGGCRTAAWSC